jgi:hypothetical protein
MVLVGKRFVRSIQHANRELSIILSTKGGDAHVIVWKIDESGGGYDSIGTNIR